MSKEQLQGIVAGLIVSIVIGLIGTSLEALGNARQWPWLVSLGKKIEAVGQDLPKLAGQRAPDERILKAEVAATRATPGT